MATVNNDKAAHDEMVALLEAARDYISQNRDIYGKRIRKNNKGELNEAAERMVVDLTLTFPELGHRSVATLLGVSWKSVRTIRYRSEPPAEAYDDGSEERAERIGNVAGDAAFIAAMNEHYTGRFYVEDPAAATEFEARNRFVVIEAPNECARYKVNQSHTIPRPITLPTKPLVPLRERIFPDEDDVALAA